MTIDEAIKHCEEVAEAEERSAKLHQRPDRGVKGSGKRYLSCIECAKEHRQLAEWLRELKAYQDSPVLQRWLKQCDTCKYRHKKASEPPCRRCCHTYRNKYEYDETREQNLAYADEPTMQSAT